MATVASEYPAARSKVMLDAGPNLSTRSLLPSGSRKYTQYGPSDYPLSDRERPRQSRQPPKRPYVPLGCSIQIIGAYGGVPRQPAE